MAGLTSSDPKWYIGEIIEEITVAGEPRNVVHRDIKVLYANSPEEAYGKAQALDNELETDRLDPERKLVRTRFWGLAELNVAHDDVKGGAALFYQEDIGVPGEKTHHWILPKRNLIASYPAEAIPALSFSFKPNNSKPVSPG
ncbi:MAG TPA: DUF4288 domain-containing protein [Candidatus Angelobacter sp.]|nr:DUF4288 domain-containing protein [Candidatus Angelobacter sp.]